MDTNPITNPPAPLVREYTEYLGVKLRLGRKRYGRGVLSFAFVSDDTTLFLIGNNLN